jgi:hypothetical protein
VNFVEQLEILHAAQRDPALLALALVDFAHPGLAPTERARIKAALLAAAVPHWCDAGFLAALLDTTTDDGERLMLQLGSLTVIEPFPARGAGANSVQREARASLRRHLQQTAPTQFAGLVKRAHQYVSGIDGDDARVEAVFHRFSLDPTAASPECVDIYTELEKRGSGDIRRMLFMSLIEVIGTRPAQPAAEREASVDQKASHAEASPPLAAFRRPASAPIAFDVFLCHNSQDKQEVEDIGLELRKRNLRPWLDRWELPPGQPWQQLLEDQIETIGAAAVFVGRSGFGPWQNAELRAFLGEFQRRSCPVIPVILNSVQEVPRLPAFLGGMTWVDFRDLASMPYSMLVWGVTRKRPPELP